MILSRKVRRSLRSEKTQPKGLKGFDLEKAYIACKKGIEEKTLIPWSGAPAGWLDEFYKEKGYIPTLYPGEKENSSQC